MRFLLCFLYSWWKNNLLVSYGEWKINEKAVSARVFLCFTTSLMKLPVSFLWGVKNQWESYVWGFCSIFAKSLMRDICESEIFCLIFLQVSDEWKKVFVCEIFASYFTTSQGWMKNLLICEIFALLFHCKSLMKEKFVSLWNFCLIFYYKSVMNEKTC